MKSFMGALFATSLIVLVALATQQPADMSNQMRQFFASDPTEFRGYQKKWSRLEPSIRFFKRTVLPMYSAEK
ncbi:hypothetical protein ANCCAN_16451 [Ancylostoma caninum]|uniref:Nematode fatty acid retinoid binding protein n=1 Tax=Ancylostoma caninum TaxID=29170 RepID=A0A368G2X7_ANCCA|nr:hypothetical protein ANCCAN_16451 [Ancylostoma caninum]